MEVKKQIEALSHWVERYPGRHVRVLREIHAMDIAQRHGLALWDIYLFALEQGILPYRYIRNVDALRIEEQLILHKGHVAVIGAGGLGGHVISSLARLGVGMISVVDPDQFDESNLNRQAFCNTSTMGRPKAEVVAEALREINPAVRVRAFVERFNRDNAGGILSGVDVAVDALDNPLDRLVLERECKGRGIPFVHGAVAGLEGQLMTIFPGDRGLDGIYGEALEGSASSSPRPEAVLGVLAPSPQFIASLQVAEVLKILLTRGQTFRSSMVYVDLETGMLNRFGF